MKLPLLYSLQHCPYAMRARMGILMAEQHVLLRAIKTKNKPPHLLHISPKGTVPVLLLPNHQVIDESLDIMLWALKEHDPHNLLHTHEPLALRRMLELIKLNDTQFKPVLEKYKFYARTKDMAQLYFRKACEEFIKQFEAKLTAHKYLISDNKSLADYALLPFIRQFARVDKHWFAQSEYTKVRAWLNHFLQAPMFTKVMTKYDLYMDTGNEHLYGSKKR
ncbi:glutathione S-transferase [Pseudoalteromonas sp. S3178]|uniref:glutathione S-transferase n=1 Tax=Pseudoalteromonas sp. S3178 TaxID=579532 RepID=UPI00110A333A|nr:glutathione S-transferase [Pseudoalteromonas sp. S3178]TMP06300.1 glutathione S-transferase [Pseudoalteromonas sp. S3178]